MPTFTMATRLSAAFAHLVQDDYIPVPVANSTAIDDAESAASDHAFLRNVLSDTSRILLSRDDTSLPDINSSSTDNESSVSNIVPVVSALTFHNGRKRGQQCSYNGYVYSLNKTRPDEIRYWDCKDRR